MKIQKLQERGLKLKRKFAEENAQGAEQTITFSIHRLTKTGKLFGIPAKLFLANNHSRIYGFLS